MLHAGVEKNAIYDGGSFELYPDSIVRGHRIYTASGLRAAESGRAGWGDSLHRTVAYSSAGRMADALFAAALADTSALTVADVRLAGAFLRPEESMAALRAEVADGCVRGRGFPEGFRHRLLGHCRPGTVLCDRLAPVAQRSL